MFFGESSIILVAGTALILNILLPKDGVDKVVEQEMLAEIRQAAD